MQEAEGRLFEISQQNMKKDYTQINPVIAEAYQLIQKAAARTDGLSGLESGFTKLDKMTSGWQNSDLIIIAARPAMGKTAFVLSMAKNIAVNYRNPVAVFSLEMSNVQLVNRLISNACEIPRKSRVDSWQIMNGNSWTINCVIFWMRRYMWMILLLCLYLSYVQKHAVWCVSMG